MRLPLIRSIIAVLAGFLTIVAVTKVGTLLLGRLLIDAADVPNASEAWVAPLTYLMAHLAVSLLGALIGGYLTARMIGRASRPQVVALVAVIVIASIITWLQQRDPAASGQPGWYPIVVTLIGVVGVLAGGHLGSRHAPLPGRPPAA